MLGGGRAFLPRCVLQAGLLTRDHPVPRLPDPLGQWHVTASVPLTALGALRNWPCFASTCLTAFPILPPMAGTWRMVFEYARSLPAEPFATAGNLLGIVTEETA